MPYFRTLLHAICIFVASLHISKSISRQSVAAIRSMVACIHSLVTNCSFARPSVLAGQHSTASAILRSQTAASWVKSCRGAEVAIFRQTAANFRQRKVWVLKISILPHNTPKIGDSQPNILYFGKKITDKLKFGGEGMPDTYMPVAVEFVTNSY